MDNAAQQWLDAVSSSFTDGSLVKISLGNYSGSEPALKQIHIRRILVKRVEKLSFTFRYQTRDVVKNFTLPESIAALSEWLKDFGTATLCTTVFDLKYDKPHKGAATCKQQPPTQQAPADLSHDRQKNRLVGTKNKPYLHALGITDATGNVYKTAQDKYRQIDKYVEILSGLLAPLPADKIRRMADMGSGKGYLTFALYDYITSTLGRSVEITGVEYRADLVALCNQIASDAGFTGLKFVQGTIADFDSTGIDALIALHACDTATDDALAKGIHAGAELLVVAPCCHKQIRREMEAGSGAADLAFLTRHGTFLERQAEMVTDGMRAQLLEYSGYSTKLFEFISDAHTPKNVMIVASKNPRIATHDAALLAKFSAAKRFFGIGSHQLEKLLGL